MTPEKVNPDVLELVEVLIWLALVFFLIGCAGLARWMHDFMAARNRRLRERRRAALASLSQKSQEYEDGYR